jgi:hypothetical protein
MTTPTAIRPTSATRHALRYIQHATHVLVLIDLVFTAVAYLAALPPVAGWLATVLPISPLPPVRQDTTIVLTTSAITLVLITAGGLHIANRHPAQYRPNTTPAVGHGTAPSQGR